VIGKGAVIDIVSAHGQRHLVGEVEKQAVRLRLPAPGAQDAAPSLHVRRQRRRTFFRRQRQRAQHRAGPGGLEAVGRVLAGHPVAGHEALREQVEQVSTPAGPRVDQAGPRAQLVGRLQRAQGERGVGDAVAPLAGQPGGAAGVFLEPRAAAVGIGERGAQDRQRSDDLRADGLDTVTACMAQHQLLDEGRGPVFGLRKGSGIDHARQSLPVEALPAIDQAVDLPVVPVAVALRITSRCG
jgi:hypothetical protein